jgi:hypothetical protein
MSEQPILRALNEAGETYDDPSEDLLFELLADLREGNSFLIIERVESGRGLDNYYMQTVIGGSGRFALEYREGPKESHYRTDVDSMRTVHAAVTKWAFDVPGWKDGLAWTQVRY